LLFAALLVLSALFFPDAPRGEVNMQAEIHPRYEEVTARCSCGNEIKTRSTLCEDITIDVCSQCHPFFTGKQKIVDTGGRVDRFKKRFSGRSLKK
jgi:large subunit ribosomal protein L31